MAQIFSIINNKGGTGKTTTTLNLGAALVKKKKKVLLIDFDGQCNLSSALSVNGQEPHVGNLLLGQSTFDECISKHKMLSIIPGTEKMLDFEHQINNEPGREYLLKEVLDHVDGKFDYVLIDCPPNLGILSINSLVSADYFVVPMQTENFAFIGLDKILDITAKVKKRLNTSLDLAGILLIKYAPKTKFSQAVISNISSNAKLKNKLFKSHIRQDIALMECSAFGQTIYEYAPTSRGAEDYDNFAKEILKNYGKK